MSPAGQDAAPGGQREPQLPLAGAATAGLLAAGLLAAGTILWSALPLAGGGMRFCLSLAVVCGAMSIGQVAITATLARDTYGLSLAEKIMRRLADLVRLLPWAEVMTVAVLVLEALHKSRPWHTAVLAIALTGYLLAVHLTETRAGASVLRAQLPLIGAGAGLAALAVGAATLPGLPPGPVGAIARISAVVIATVVGGLAAPVWLGRRR